MESFTKSLQTEPSSSALLGGDDCLIFPVPGWIKEFLSSKSRLEPAPSGNSKNSTTDSGVILHSRRRELTRV